MKQHKSFSQFIFHWLAGFFCLFFIGSLCSPVAHAFIQTQYTRGEPSIKTVGTSSNQEDDSYLINPGSILVEWLTTGKKSLDNQVFPNNTYIRLCFKSRKEVSFYRSKSSDPPHFTSSNNGSLDNEPSQGHNVSVLLKIQSVSGRDVVHYDPGKWRFNSDCASFTNNAKTTEDEVPVPTQVVITTADDLLPINSSKNYLMPYEKPTQNSGKGDVYASGGAFDDGPDDKDDFWKRPGGGSERILYAWSLDKLSILLTQIGLQPNKEQQRRPAIYLVVWHDGWRSTNIAIPVELWRVMVKRNHHRDPRVLRALSQNPVDPTAAYWQWVEQNPDLNKLYGTNPTLILDHLSLLALIPGKAPAPVRQPGGEQVESSGQSGEAQKTQQQTSNQPAAPSDKSINEHRGRDGKADDGDGDHPPSQNIKCMNCGKPVVESKSYCQDCLDLQEAVKSQVQEKYNTKLNEALKEATIFDNPHALIEAKALIKVGATLEFPLIIEMLSEFIGHKSKMSIRERAKIIEPWVDLWIKSHFIDIESEEWKKIISAGLKAELGDMHKEKLYGYPIIWLKWLPKKFLQPLLDDEFVNAVKERKYWKAQLLKENGAKVNQADIVAELEKAVADNDVKRTKNLVRLKYTKYEPAMTLLFKNLFSKNHGSYSIPIANSYFARGAVVTTKIMQNAISKYTRHKKNLLKALIKRSQPEVLVAGLNHAFSINKINAIEAMIKLGGDTITSLITVELMQNSKYSYSQYAHELADSASLSPGIADAGLQEAILRGSSSKAKHWIKLGAVADASQLAKGLEKAAERGRSTSAKEWRELGAPFDVDQLNRGLEKAVQKGNLEFIREWVELGAIPSQKALLAVINKAIIMKGRIKRAKAWKHLDYLYPNSTASKSSDEYDEAMLTGDSSKIKCWIVAFGRFNSGSQFDKWFKKESEHVRSTSAKKRIKPGTHFEVDQLNNGLENAAQKDDLEFIREWVELGAIPSHKAFFAVMSKAIIMKNLIERAKAMKNVNYLDPDSSDSQTYEKLQRSKVRDKKI
ncbi:hypothetical protein [Endozoicomonas euniceicola]|uniref:Uncharacterized protein n=1 Tax=Endozoicomonas euniceicola TaxID=1234143 RepID=A0ABY6GXW0_9GAMM|nr:hypothetical protein [Endozoicomonas euniceicola]UYM17615.1 hypothetical protein NX720_06835 [Endozoicomonas euniceicola]